MSNTCYDDQMDYISSYRCMLKSKGFTQRELMLSSLGQLQSESSEVWGAAYKALAYDMKPSDRSSRIFSAYQELGDVVFCVNWVLAELNETFGWSVTLHEAIVMSNLSIQSKLEVVHDQTSAY